MLKLARTYKYFPRLLWQDIYISGLMLRFALKTSFCLSPERTLPIPGIELALFFLKDHVV